jgi:hypothetical protein
VLCTRPSGDDYLGKATYNLSEVVPLPEPLAVDLGTGRF